MVNFLNYQYLFGGFLVLKPTIWSFLVETIDKVAQDNALEANKEVQVTAPGEQTNAVADGEDTGTHQEHIKEALELLYVHFPKAFIKEGDCKPLKIGILEDLKPLIANIEGLSISKVRAAVRVYTTRLRYFYSVREGAQRVDLNGNEVEPVTAEHAEYARTRFTEINNKRRPAKPKKPQGRPFNKGKRPNNGEGQGDGQQRRFNNRDGQLQRRFNNRNNNNQRKFEPAKESDIRIGRYVFVSTDRSYVKGTVSEDLNGDTVSITTMNGLPVNVPLSRVFLSVGGAPRPKRNFNNNGSNGHYNKGPRNNYRNNNNRRPNGNHQNGKVAPNSAE